MSDSAKGILAMVAACVIWGLSPIFYKALAHVPPLEVLSHRTVWSLVIFSAVLAAQRRLREVLTLVTAPRAALFSALAAVMISTNWFFYIFSIQTGRAVQASLGYYIFPLVAVLLGVAVARERLSLMQWLPVGLAAAAVLLLAVGLGAPPWISLILAFTFGFYGIVKKYTSAGPVVSVTAEVLILVPLALFWLAMVHGAGWQEMSGRQGAVFGRDLTDSALLVVSGAITAGPLIFFSYASRRLTMATLGLLQYINPTLQFMCAVVIFREPFTSWHAVAFGLIWLALAIYSASSLQRERSARRAAASAGVSSTSVI